MVLQVKMPSFEPEEDHTEVRLNHVLLQEIHLKSPLHLHVFTASEEQPVLLTSKTKERFSLASVVFRTLGSDSGMEGSIHCPLSSHLVLH